MKKNNLTAFTLVELIVTIIILAILGTIAFFALQGYAKSSRDSARISDLSRMKTSIEIFHIEAGKYPEPTNFVPIVYSGGVVWYQGTFGENTFTNVEKLDRIPIDPLTENMYTYSITQNKNEFQIGGVVESGDFTYSNLVGKSYAATVEAKAYVVGNYNGRVIKSTNGSNCNILSAPSIIASDTSTSTDLVDILINKRIVYSGFNNLPDSFKNSKFKSDGIFNFTPNNIKLYSDTGSCRPLALDQNLRIALFNNLNDSYSGTTLNNLSLSDNFSASCTSQDRLVYGSYYVVKDALGIDTGYIKVPSNCIINNNNNSTPTPPTTDTTPPTILSSGPSGSIAITPTLIEVTTDENATCKYDTSNVSYASMTNTFATTGSTYSSSNFTPTVGSNSLYVICSDAAGNTSTPTNIVFDYVNSTPVNITMYPASGGTYTCELCN